jgi:Fur family ferric uptake transcriptional regulator
VDDAPVEFNSDIENQLKDQTQFKIMGHTLEFVGICPSCQNSSESA